MTHQTEILAKAAILMMGSAVTAGVAMIETAAPLIEKLGVPVALAAVALWLAVKSNQGRVTDLSNALKAREDDVKQANEHRIAMLGTLQKMETAIVTQTTRMEDKFDKLIESIKKSPP